ncbi:hypothetical protein MBANPS3_009276 [Mucor bainieri]
MKYLVLTLCLYMAHVGCQQQQHEQRMSAAAMTSSVTSSQLPDQAMSASLETVVVVPLSHIDSILPFDSFKSFTYVSPQANASTTINSMEPTATVNHTTEQPIYAAAAQAEAQASVQLNKASSNAASHTNESSMTQIKTSSASSIPPLSSSSSSVVSPPAAEVNPSKSKAPVLAKMDIKANAQIPPKTSMAQATNPPNNPKAVPPPPPPPAANKASPSPAPPAAAAAAQANNKAKVVAPNAAAASISTTTATTTATATVTATATATVTKSITATKTVTLSYEDAAEKRMKSCYRKNRKVPFSQYWIPKENEWDETNDGERVFLGGDEKVTLNDTHHKPLGQVTPQMYDKCKMEGTCLLDNGDLINIDNTTDNFIKVGGRGREHNVFGLGSGAQNLVPYISVAVNDIPYGQKLYISKLDGVDLGYGIKHNGCVRVDDDSWSFEYLEDEVSIKYAECELKNYVTKQHLALVKATSNEKIIPSLMNATYKH